MSKYLIALSFGVFTFIYSNAQTSISGIINNYARVVAIDYCAQQLTLQDAGDFQIDDQILVIQMQGAEINTSDSNQFGSISNLNGAGLCEKATIADIQDDVVTLEFALANTYETTGNVQIVSIPQYASVMVTAPLLAQDWDGNTGGVLALNADTLTLEANIDATGSGFRGGTLELDYDGDCFWFIVHNNYAYDAESIRGGNKGEGISQITPDLARGKGAPANGGGGGNDHNAGGGGGGLISAGGRGGENNNPSTFGCQGAHPGIGGYAIGTTSQRLFMGGGGGAGHTNNANNTTKADGGGIIIIETGFLSANGHSIRSNGEAVPVTTNGDGASGGGAGGSLYISADSQDDSSLLLEAKGGHGGHANNFGSDQCFGPGGGGAGGFISTNAALLYTANTDGGNAGLSINSSSCGEGTNGAQNGSDGQLGNLTIPESSMIIESPEITAIDTIVLACLSSSATLEASVSGSNYTLQWQVNMGSGYTNLTEGAIYQQVNTASLFISAVETPLFGYSFRLEVISDCGEVIYSSPVTLEQYPYPIPFYSWVIDGLTIYFTNLSSNADNYSWNFANLGTSTEVNPAFEFPAPGSYYVLMSVTNNVCDGSAALAYTITIPELATAIASPESVNECAPTTINFVSNSEEAESIQWFFPGSDTPTSTDENVNVFYGTPGDYTATLIATNDGGSDTLEIPVALAPAPVSDFSFTIMDTEVTFTNLSNFANTYQWFFGDGESSTIPEPVHTYDGPGAYTITLMAENECGVDSLSIPVQIGDPPTAQFTIQGPSGGCEPFQAIFSNLSAGVYDSLLWAFPGGAPASSTLEMPTVLYENAGTYDVSLTLYSSYPPVTITESPYIEVYAFPTPDFDYTINGLELTLINLSSGAEEYTWSFGDGNISMEENPVHTYQQSGTYSVTLNATNGNCNSSTSTSINLGTSNVEQQQKQYALKIYPNPTKGFINIQTNWKWKQWAIYSPLGIRASSGEYNGNNILEFSHLPPAAYTLVFTGQEHTMYIPLIIIK
jgi:PKD repeat protein